MFSFGMFCIAMFFLIGVHEYGHYIVAIKTGIKVEKFFIGFGPTLFSWVGKNGVQFGLKLIPFGGFVSMSGESPDKATGKADDYFSQPVWKRISVAAAGPVFNFFFAIAIFIYLGVSGVTVTSPIVGYIQPSSISDKSGFINGDRITNIDDFVIHSWRDMNRAFQEGDGVYRVQVKNKEDKRIITLEGEAVKKDPLMTRYPEEVFGFYSSKYMILESFNKDSAAEKAGLKINDIIYSIKKDNDIAVVSYSRNNDDKVLIKNIPLSNNGMIGIYMKRVAGIHEEFKLPVLESVSYGLSEAYYMGKINLVGAYKLMTNAIPVDNIGGPIMIADFAGKTARMGIDTFLFFIAAISMALGVMNLLPIPALDGGLIVMYVIEGIRKKAMSEKMMVGLFKVGYGILFCLISLAMYNDINKYFL